MSQDTLSLSITGLWLCENSETRVHVSLNFLLTPKEGQIHVRRSTITRSEARDKSQLPGVSGVWRLSSSQISSGEKMWKRRQRPWEEVASPIVITDCFKQGRRRTWPPLRQFPFHSIRTFWDGSALNSVLSEKSWQERSYKKKLSQNATTEHLETFPRILYYRGKKGDKRVMDFPLLPIFSGDKKQMDEYWYLGGFFPCERI